MTFEIARNRAAECKFGAQTQKPATARLYANQATLKHNLNIHPPPIPYPLKRSQPRGRIQIWSGAPTTVSSYTPTSHTPPFQTPATARLYTNLERL